MDTLFRLAGLGVLVLLLLAIREGYKYLTRGRQEVIPPPSYLGLQDYQVQDGQWVRYLLVDGIIYEVLTKFSNREEIEGWFGEYIRTAPRCSRCGGRIFPLEPIGKVWRGSFAHIECCEDPSYLWGTIGEGGETVPLFDGKTLSHYVFVHGVGVYLTNLRAPTLEDTPTILLRHAYFPGGERY